MSNANVVALQNATNRYARGAGFPLLVVDGGMGINTANGVLRALGWIVRDGCGPYNVCVSDVTQEKATALLAAIVADNGSIDQTAIMQSNVGLTLFLNTAANTIGLPYASSPTPTVNQGPIASNPASYTPPGSALQPPPMVGASLVDKLKMMPTWQKVVVGVLAGLGVLWIHQRVRGGGGLGGFAAPWLKDHKTGEYVRPASGHEVAWYKHKGRVDLPQHASRGGGLRRYEVVDR